MRKKKASLPLTLPVRTPVRVKRRGKRVVLSVPPYIFSLIWDSSIPIPTTYSPTLVASNWAFHFFLHIRRFWWYSCTAVVIKHRWSILQSSAGFPDFFRGEVREEDFAYTVFVSATKSFFFLWRGEREASGCWAGGWYGRTRGEGGGKMIWRDRHGIGSLFG